MPKVRGKVFVKIYELILLLTLIFLNGVFIVFGQYVPTPSQEINPQKNVERDLQKLRQDIQKSRAEDEFRREHKNEKKRDLKKIEADKKDLELFRDFLSQPNTGILRLYDLAECLKDAEKCPKTVASRGSEFCFKSFKYNNKDNADISFENSILHLKEQDSLSFFTDMGDFDIEKITLADVKDLAEFRPSTDIETIKNQVFLVENGFKLGEFTYKNSLPLNEKSTYALRIIHYEIGKKAKNIHSFQPRGDLADFLIVFRFIRKHENGSISLLWKRLQVKESPIIFVE